MSEDIFCCPDGASVDADGRISMPSSGCQDDGVRWSGAFRVSPGEDDYLFWAWVISDPIRRKGLKTLADMQSLKAAFGKL
jgi:hypothetical protein